MRVSALRKLSHCFGSPAVGVHSRIHLVIFRNCQHGSPKTIFREAPGGPCAVGG
jgi:hypothetical protein